MKSAAVLILFAALAGPAAAHPQHDAPRAAEKSIPEKAQDAVMLEITRAKLDPSWRKAAAGTPKQRTVDGALRWVVPFRGAAGAAAGRTLYVSLTSDGNLIGTSLGGK